jgi:pyruvate formate-lyase activating enzyme-like uncharacterized protein
MGIMIVDITRETYGRISNPVFATYAARYLDIYDHFMEQVRATGIQVDEIDYAGETAERLARLRQKGATFRNGGRSIVVNTISPACEACRHGIASATFFVSLRCHRDCYYCFNPNQVDYEYYQEHQQDLEQELKNIAASGYRLDYLALTGGEPLVHKEEAVAFFETAKQHFPAGHTRLYTTGDQADEELLTCLQKAGLQEIRFSIRLHDLARGHRHTLQRIALARDYVPAVMVEMPIMPDCIDVMQDVLRELDDLQIHSINLLELCYPLANAGAFNERNYRVRRRPYHILYNYWYAGGVPIARSELACLDLLEFALDQDLAIGVHYCSLENKLTGQNFQQNSQGQLPETHYFSQKDFLLKSAKVFGHDVPQVFNAFRHKGYRDFVRSKEHRYLEFHIDRISMLKDVDVEIGLSTSILEQREDGQYLRELKVDLTTPQAFDRQEDV